MSAPDGIRADLAQVLADVARAVPGVTAVYEHRSPAAAVLTGLVVALRGARAMPPVLIREESGALAVEATIGVSATASAAAVARAVHAALSGALDAAGVERSVVRVRVATVG